jgi:hypothetical protein
MTSKNINGYVSKETRATTLLFIASVIKMRRELVNIYFIQKKTALSR